MSTTFEMNNIYIFNKVIDLFYVKAIADTNYYSKQSILMSLKHVWKASLRFISLLTKAGGVILWLSLDSLAAV